MEGTKRWYKSTTINNCIAAIGILFVNITSAIFIFLNSVRPGTVAEEEIQTIKEQTPAIASSIVIILTGIVAVWKTIMAIMGRFAAREEIKQK